MSDENGGGAVFSELRKQFLVAREVPPALAGAHRADFEGWRVFAAPELPVVPVRGQDGETAALVLGWALRKGQWLQDGQAFTLDPGEDLAAFFDHLAGRYVALYQGGDGPRFRLDGGGLLPAVYSAERGQIASTPTLLDRLEGLDRRPEVDAIFSFPENRGFLPFGLTPYRGVERLEPNHEIQLGDFAVHRVWPDFTDPAAAMLDRESARAAIRSIAEEAAQNATAILDAGHKGLYLSGGHDSRMVLAACHERAETLACETIRTGSGIDAHVTRKVARALGIGLDILEIEPASREEVAGWLWRTGYTLYDPVTELVRTAERQDRGYHVMTGTTCEIMRASNWERDDLDGRDIDLEGLLLRLRVPPAPPVMEAGTRWLEELNSRRATFVLDMAKIEQIHGCWAGPSIYGHRIAFPSLNPYSFQRMFRTAVLLPEAYKLDGESYRDAVGHLWPALLDLPVNRAEGLEKLRFAKHELKAMIPTRVKRWIKPYR